MYAFGVLFGKEFEFFVYIVHPASPWWSPAPFIPIHQGGGGVQLTAKMVENKICMLWGYFSARNSNFFVYIVHPPRHGGPPPHLYPSNRVEGGTSYRQNGGEQSMYALGVLFGKEFEFFVYIVLPPHLYSSSRVEGYNLPQKLRKIRAVCCRGIFGRRIRSCGPR